MPLYLVKLVALFCKAIQASKFNPLYYIIMNPQLNWKTAYKTVYSLPYIQKICWKYEYEKLSQGGGRSSLHKLLFLVKKEEELMYNIWVN